MMVAPAKAGAQFTARDALGPRLRGDDNIALRRQSARYVVVFSRYACPPP